MLMKCIDLFFLIPWILYWVCCLSHLWGKAVNQVHLLAQRYHVFHQVRSYFPIYITLTFLCNIWYIKFLNIFSIKIKIKFSLVENMMVSQEPVKSVNFYLIFYLWIRRTERIVMNNIIKDWRRLIIILIIIARAYLETKFIL